MCKSKKKQRNDTEMIIKTSTREKLESKTENQNLDFKQSNML